MTVVRLPVARSYLRDAALIAQMESALYNWAFAPDIETLRMHIYKDIGISVEDAKRLDGRVIEALRVRMRTMREK